MKILSAEQIRGVDAYTIRHEPIASIDLMERASRTFFRTFQKLYDSSYPVVVMAGTGNNGGDGLAVARMLALEGYQVEIYIVNPSHSQGSQDFATNLRRLAEIQGYQMIYSESSIPKISADCVLIDALFGSGLSRPLQGLHARIVEAINGSAARRVALDIASGLFADHSVAEGHPVTRVDHTLTFQFPKLAFFLAENAPYVGNLEVLDIGLHPDAIRRENTNYYSVAPSLISNWLSPRPKHAHKGTFGRALLVAGSYGKVGAAILSSRACLRAGAGLLTTYIPDCGYGAMQSAVPEAMVLEGAGNRTVTHAPNTDGYTVVGVGPGLGQASDTAKALEELLVKATGPMVLDADALNLLGSHRDLLDLLPRNSVLTPHPKELNRLTEESARGWEQLETSRAFARRYGVVLVLKGAHTATTLPDGRTYFNNTGNPGMATAGSGDVLTGIILGLMAQGITPSRAAVLGVYLHGFAGDLAAKKQGVHALMASDIIEMMGPAFMEITMG